MENRQLPPSVISGRMAPRRNLLLNRNGCPNDRIPLKAFVVDFALPLLHPPTPLCLLYLPSPQRPLAAYAHPSERPSLDLRRARIRPRSVRSPSPSSAPTELSQVAPVAPRLPPPLNSAHPPLPVSTATQTNYFPHLCHLVPPHLPDRPPKPLTIPSTAPVPATFLKIVTLLVSTRRRRREREE